MSDLVRNLIRGAAATMLATGVMTGTNAARAQDAGAIPNTEGVSCRVSVVVGYPLSQKKERFPGQNRLTTDDAIDVASTINDTTRIAKLGDVSAYVECSNDQINGTDNQSKLELDEVQSVVLENSAICPGGLNNLHIAAVERDELGDVVARNVANGGLQATAQELVGLQQAFNGAAKVADISLGAYTVCSDNQRKDTPTNPDFTSSELHHMELKF